MRAQTQLGSTFNQHTHYFNATNVGNADGTLNTVNADITSYTMPYAGCILGFGASASGTLNTGTLTFRPTITGSLSAPFAGGTLDHSTTNPYFTQSADQQYYRFNAGDRIGLMWNKTGTVEPTTNDLTVGLVVLYEDVRY